MSGDDMDIALAGQEDDDDDPRIGDDGGERAMCKQGARCCKPSRYRVAAAETDSHQRRLVDITRDKPIKVVVRVALPVRDHPKFNFVGKLLGPKGNSLKRLQEETMTKMAILGRGSMRDRHKEEELRNCGDPRFSHLSDELHVEVTALAPPAEAHARIAYALSEVRRFLVPDYNDEIRQEQMWEMRVLKRCSSPNNDDGNEEDHVDHEVHENNADNDNDNANANAKDNNNDHHSINKNVDSGCGCGGGDGDDADEWRRGGEPKSSPTTAAALQSRSRSRSRLCSPHSKANGGAVCLDSRLAPPLLRASAVAPTAGPILAPALLPLPVPTPTPAPAPASTLTPAQHPAARAFKNKSVVTLASSSLSGAAAAANPTMVARKRCLLGSGAAYGTRLFMSPTKRTVLSILARAKAAQCKQLQLQLPPPFARHPHFTATEPSGRVTSSLSDRWTLLVDS